MSTPRTERLWWTRLRWRMRGAWLWPAFVVLTVVDGVLLTRLPPYGSGPRDIVSGVLLAGFLNLFLVAVVAPLLGRRLRRRRSDLPRVVANDYAGTALIWAAAFAFVIGGLLHRPAVLGEQEDRRAQFAAVHAYISASAPEYQPGLRAVDSLRIEPDVYRTCVPGSDPKRPLCLIVNTDQHPASVTRDKDRASNASYRVWGGFE